MAQYDDRGALGQGLNDDQSRDRCVDDGGRRTTDPMTATTMRTVIACAVRDPQASSSTLEATDVAVFNSSRGIEPSASVASPRHGRRRRSGSSAARECRVLSLRAEIQTTATEVLSGRRHPCPEPGEGGLAESQDPHGRWINRPRSGQPACARSATHDCYREIPKFK
jgi:hypothetical protein